MNVRPSILCPIDFSDGSAGALRYAAAIASHFLTRLIVLTVEDPLLTEATDLGTGIRWDPANCKQEMARFAARTLGPSSPSLTALEYDVAVGKPAPEILRVARERSCDLIVISTHGLTGIRKLFFGSTTERVLRETTRPVLITPPPLDSGQVSLDDAKRILRRIVVPVDLTPGSRHQAAVAAGLAEAAGVPLILVHVIEPVKSRLAAKLHLAGLEADRRAVAEDALHAIAASLPRVHVEALLAYGDPAEELAKVAHDRQAGLVIMGLHGSPLLGPRMGSVTYRMLCLVHTLVLALPPDRIEALGAGAAASAAAASVTG